MFGPSIGGFLFDSGGFALPFWVFGATALVLSVFCQIFLKDVHEAYDGVDGNRDVTWKEILKAPGMTQSIVYVYMLAISKEGIMTEFFLFF